MANTYKKIVLEDIKNIIPFIKFVFTRLPLKALSWSLQSLILILQLFGFLFFFVSFIVGVIISWNWLWNIGQKLMVGFGIFFVVLMFIALYHESIEKRLKKVHIIPKR
jgi:hypothetical protein